MSTPATNATTLRLVTIETSAAQLDADKLEFERRYKRWTLRRRIQLPEEQLRIICAIFFNFGVRQGIKSGQAEGQAEIDRLKAHIDNLNHDLATQNAEDDGLSESERLTRSGYDGY